MKYDEMKKIIEVLGDYTPVHSNSMFGAADLLYLGGVTSKELNEADKEYRQRKGYGSNFPDERTAKTIIELKKLEDKDIRPIVISPGEILVSEDVYQRWGEKILKILHGGGQSKITIIKEDKENAV